MTIGAERGCLVPKSCVNTVYQCSIAARARLWRWTRPRCWSGSRRRSHRRCGGWSRSRLHFKRADIDATIEHTNKRSAALVIEGRRSKLRVARINRRTAGQQLMRESWAAIVLQGAKQRIGIDLIARAGQETTG